MWGSKSAAKAVEWSGVSTKTLTNSYVASDEMLVDFPKRMTIFPYYSAGATETGNNLDFVLEVNPLDSNQDPTGVYWSQVGNYIDSAGTWTEQNSKFLVVQGTPGVYEPGCPLDYTNLNAARIRFKCKENGVASNYGSIRFWVVKADLT
jgi:hypothetical protein